MKKLTVLLTLFVVLASAQSARAWVKAVDTGVVILATKYLSGDVKAELDKYLGESYADDVRHLYALEADKKAKHSKEIHYLHLDSEFKPLAVEGDDALKAIEESMAVVRNRGSHSKTDVVFALRTIINLMCDIHNLSYVRIENIPHSHQDFTITCVAGEYGKYKKKISKYKWSRYWSYYASWHRGFSGALWAEDIDLCYSSQRAEYSKGTLRDWVTQIGAQSAKVYGVVSPDYVMPRMVRLEYEDVNYEMIARAGYRLSVVLNDILK